MALDQNISYKFLGIEFIFFGNIFIPKKNPFD